MRTQVNLLPELEDERQEFERQLSKADQALVAVEQHAEVTALLHGRLEMLRQAMQAAERCRHLVEACPDEELRTHLADLQRRHTDAHHRSFKLRQTLTDCRTWAKSDRAEAAHASSPRKEQELRALTERREAWSEPREGDASSLHKEQKPREPAEPRKAKAAECETELSEVLTQLAGLEKQMQAAPDAMLDP